MHLFGLLYGLLYGLLIGLLFRLSSELLSRPLVGLLFGLSGGLSDGLIFGLVFGLVFGLISGLLFGLKPVIQHLCLRFVLYRTSVAPWDYAKFLEHAENHRFIQRVGGRYRFVHDLLRKRFAQRYQPRYR